MKTAFLLGGVIIVCLLCFAFPVFAADGLYGDFTDDNIVDVNDLHDFCVLCLVNDYNQTAGISANFPCLQTTGCGNIRPPLPHLKI